MNRLVVLGLGCLVLGFSSASAQSTLGKKDLPGLIEKLGSSDAKVRESACNGIGEIGARKRIHALDAHERLAKLMVDDKDAKVRTAAANALAACEADAVKAMPSLMNRLEKEDDQNALRAAIVAVGYVDDMGKAKEALPRLKEILEKYRAEAKAAQAEVTQAIKDGDKEKQNKAQQRAGQANNMSQAAQGTIQRLTGKN